MKKKYFILILFFILLFGCNYKYPKQEKIYNFYIKKIKSEFITTLDSISPRVIDLKQIAFIDSLPTLIFHINTYPVLYFLNLKTKTIYHTISFPYHYLERFYLYNKDSILLAFSSSNFQFGYADSSLMLCDYQGNIYKYLHLQDTILWSSISTIKEPKKAYYEALSFNGFQFIDKYKIFFPIRNYTSVPTFKMAYYDIKKEKLFISKANISEYPKPNIYYPQSYYRLNIATQHKGNPMFTFGFSPNIYEWDVSNDVIIMHNIKSYLADSIPSIQSPDIDISINYAKINSLYYDDEKGFFYENILFSNAYKGIYVPIIIDKNFRTVAIGLQTKYFPPMPVTTSLKNELITPILTTKGDSLILFHTSHPIFYGIVNVDSIKEVLDSLYNPDLDIIKQISKTCSLNYNNIGVIDYKPMIDKVIKHQPDSFCLITVHAEGACPSCFHAILKFISTNKDWLKKEKNWFLLILSHNQENVKLFLKNYNIDDISQIIIKPMNGTNKYFVTGKNPRLTILKNGKITFDKIYQHDNPTKIQDKIFEFYHLD